MGIPLTVRTPDLELVAATVAHLDAELDGADSLAQLLGASVPDGWPPGDYDAAAIGSFRAALHGDGESAAGWYTWYAIALDAAGHRTQLVAAAGYRGPPDDDGLVELGYAVVPQARRRGYATQIVARLTARALQFDPVRAVIADALESNVASAAVLIRCGFVAVGGGPDPGTVRYVRARGGG